jgi:tRNA (uracil-5-)-methyltransferase
MKTPFNIKIEALDDDGYGIGHSPEGKEVFIQFSAPGDTMEVLKVFRKKRKFYCRDFTLLEASKDRIEPVCTHFGMSGGCSLQHIPYPLQLKFKEEKLARLFGKEVEVLASPLTTAYRNRMDIAVTSKGIGFRRSGRWNSIVETEECVLFPELMKAAIQNLKRMMADLSLSGYDPKEHSGDVRYLILRHAKNRGELLINILGSAVFVEKAGPVAQKYFNADSLILSATDSLADVSFGTTGKFYGKDHIIEKVKGIDFKIYPNSFFQSNTYVLEKIVEYLRPYIPEGKLLDAYCGSGTFGLLFSSPRTKCCGFDNNAEAIPAAKENAANNNLEAEFILSEDRQYFPEDDFDCIILDPPRSGLHPGFLEKIKDKGSPHLLYVSCNPVSLKRDLDLLAGKYKITDIKGFDMFPHTPHLETVAVLDRITG